MGGLSVQRDWGEALSLGEQQLLCIARVVLAAPRFVFLERPSAALGAPQVDRVLRLLRERSITYITVGGGGDRTDDYHFILELAGDGGWAWKALGVAVS